MINFTVAIDGAGLQDLIDKLEPRAIRAPLRTDSPPVPQGLR